jgi:hypothetical protein
VTEGQRMFHKWVCIIVCVRARVRACVRVFFCTANKGLKILGRVGRVGKCGYYIYIIVISIICTDSHNDIFCI